MDIDIEKKVLESIKTLRNYTTEDIDYDHMDPVGRMMLTALMHESNKIDDYIKKIPEKIADRYCSDFIPYEEIGAMPAIALLAPKLKSHKDTEVVSIRTGTVFSYKAHDSKIQLNYLPIFETRLIPYLQDTGPYILTHERLSHGRETREIKGDIPYSVWLGIQTKAEIECLKGLSLLITGTNGILPEKICVGVENKELDFSTMLEMENITMLEPFDAQQSSGQFFSIINAWKEYLLNMDDTALLYINDDIIDRDLFKPRTYPKPFQQWLENEILDSFDTNTLWLRLDFPQDYIVPQDINISINIVPVTNVDVNTLTLTHSTPIAKLQKQDDSFFLRIIETSSASHKYGFNMVDDEIIVRDFDANCYNNGDLYRDIRTLYNHFIDDYYAFIEYNEIKDGEVLKRLRETINRLGKSVGENSERFKFDSGTYVMKNMSKETATSSTKVCYATTMGERGNTPKSGEMMESKRQPAIEQKVPIVISAMGGADKVSVDARYEMLRYYALTNDRLYTKMDVDAFLRKEVMVEFGEKESQRIFIRIKIQGAGGEKTLCRGLYIDIEFKDKKNYDQAQRKSFDKLMKQKIENHSCISMPIIVTLKNLEG